MHISTGEAVPTAVCHTLECDKPLHSQGLVLNSVDNGEVLTLIWQTQWL